MALHQSTVQCAADVFVVVDGRVDGSIDFFASNRKHMLRFSSSYSQQLKVMAKIRCLPRRFANIDWQAYVYHEHINCVCCVGVNLN